MSRDIPWSINIAMLKQMFWSNNKVHYWLMCVKSKYFIWCYIYSFCVTYWSFIIIMMSGKHFVFSILIYICKGIYILDLKNLEFLWGAKYVKGIIFYSKRCGAGYESFYQNCVSYYSSVEWGTEDEGSYRCCW